MSFSDYQNFFIIIVYCNDLSCKISIFIWFRWNPQEREIKSLNSMRWRRLNLECNLKHLEINAMTNSRKCFDLTLTLRFNLLISVSAVLEILFRRIQDLWVFSYKNWHLYVKAKPNNLITSNFWNIDTNWFKNNPEISKLSFYRAWRIMQ